MASPSAVPQQEQQEAIDPQIVAEQKARARAEAAQRRAEIYADLSARLKSGTAAAIEELKRLPGRTDRVLRTIAGEGNEILFWFLRIATVLLTVGFAIGILAGIVSVLSSLVF
jgi:hypothetical protein